MLERFVPGKVHQKMVLFDPESCGPEWHRANSEILEEDTYARMSPAPHWLGRFSLATYGNYRSVHRELPHSVKSLAYAMVEAGEKHYNLPRNMWTTCFVQRYDSGSFVGGHRDPWDNLDATLILAIGQFEPSRHMVNGHAEWQAPGEMLMLPCTREKARGPWHSMDPIFKGTRYAIILNKIVAERSIGF